LVYHPEGAELVPLGEGAPVVVGRLPPSDVIVPDISLSRQHARFTLAGGEVAVEDLGSRNGTLLRGAAVERAMLRLGDELTLGRVNVSVRAAERGALVGLLGYDRLCNLIDAEIGRSRFFGRPLAVLMVRAAGGEGGGTANHSTFYPRVQAALRPVDRLGI